MTQLSLSGVAVDFGATRLFEDVTFTVASGDKWGVIGRNGSGRPPCFGWSPVSWSRAAGQSREFRGSAFP